MSQKSITLVREFMAVTTNHWTFFPIVFIIAAVSELSGMALLGWVVTGFVPFFLAFLRVNTRSVLLQILCYPIFMGILTLFPIEPEILKGIYFFFITIYILLSVFQTITRSDKPTKIIPPFIFIGIHLFSALIIFPHREIYHYPFVLLIGMLIAGITFFLAFYMDQYLQFIMKNEGTSSSMPKQKIFRSGLVNSLYYLGIGTVLLLLISSFGISDYFLHGFWDKIKKGIRKLIHYISSLFSHNQDPTKLSNGLENAMNSQPDFLPGAPSLFWRIMEVLLFVLVVLILLALVAYLAFLIIRFILRRLSIKRIGYEVEEEVEAIDIHESLGPKKLQEAMKNEKEGYLSPRQRIRRIYKRRAMDSEHTGQELPFMTARELALEERTPLLSAIYEKARYSLLPCDKEDVKKLQAALRKKKTD